MKKTFPALPVFMAIEALIYLLTYAQYAATPGNSTQYPLGWWGYWDQSHYLRSAQALHGLDFRASEHWYPFGYALLGAPFASGTHGHAYLLPDLACLLAAMGAFVVVCRRLQVGEIAASAMFMFASLGGRYLRDVWVEPWNTTLSTALIWACFALYALYETSPEPRRGLARWAPCLAGVLFPLIFITRLTDAPIIGMLFLGFVLRSGLTWRARMLGIGKDVAAGALITGVPLLSLWLFIYGFAKPPYLQNAMALGFDPSTLAWRSYLLLITPDGWFVDGAGFFARWPWLLSGVACMICAPFITRSAERRVLLTLSGAIFVYFVLFCMYTDLAASGLWTYHNVHYFKWCVPGLLLLGYKLVERWRVNRVAALGACAFVLLLTCLRVVPKPVATGQGAWMIALNGQVSTHSMAAFNEFRFADQVGPERAVRDIRTVPTDVGWRFIAMHRPFLGTLTVSGLGETVWPDGVWPDGAPAEQRFGRRVALGWPCFIKSKQTLLF
jgi:hypothetical protein